MSLSIRAAVHQIELQPVLISTHGRRVWTSSHSSSRFQVFQLSLSLALSLFFQHLPRCSFSVPGNCSSLLGSSSTSERRWAARIPTRTSAVRRVVISFTLPSVSPFFLGGRLSGTRSSWRRSSVLRVGLVRGDCVWLRGGRSAWRGGGRARVGHHGRVIRAPGTAGWQHDTQANGSNWILHSLCCCWCCFFQKMTKYKDSIYLFSFHYSQNFTWSIKNNVFKMLQVKAPHWKYNQVKGFATTPSVHTVVFTHAHVGLYQVIRFLINTEFHDEMWPSKLQLATVDEPEQVKTLLHVWKAFNRYSSWYSCQANPVELICKGTYKMLLVLIQSATRYKVPCMGKIANKN